MLMCACKKALKCARAASVHAIAPGELGSRRSLVAQVKLEKFPSIHREVHISLFMKPWLAALHQKKQAAAGCCLEEGSGARARKTDIE